MCRSDGAGFPSEPHFYSSDFVSENQYFSVSRPHFLQTEQFLETYLVQFLQICTFSLMVHPCLPYPDGFAGQVTKKLYPKNFSGDLKRKSVVKKPLSGAKRLCTISRHTRQKAAEGPCPLPPLFSVTAPMSPDHPAQRDCRGNTLSPLRYKAPSDFRYSCPPCDRAQGLERPVSPQARRHP